MYNSLARRMAALCAFRHLQKRAAVVLVWLPTSVCTLTARAATIQFEQDVWPIIETSCLKCHLPSHAENGRMKHPKADLILDSANGIMKGSENGVVMVPGNPGKSPIYVRTTLDPEDDDVMPAKGDLLTLDQQKILHDWIQQGADFGNWIGNAST
ncbi:MAG: hypothetical protein O3C57_06850, partial [Verrucomicrobia bacterium]|nr:hypothetical protein [Verrucomicrobiota bacterium]